MIRTQPSFIAIDNFYDNPSQVRDFALNHCEYDVSRKSEGYSNGNAPWPGKMSKKSYQPKDLDIKISKLLNRNVVQRFGLGSGKFRISKENEVSDSVVHADDIFHEPGALAGVLYLNPNVNNVEGTILYKHIQSGERFLKDKNEMNRIIVNGEHKDIKYWQKELVSYVTWNRLIIYPAHVFHGTGPMFGNNDQDARLVQLFFWEALN